MEPFKRHRSAPCPTPHLQWHPSRKERKAELQATARYRIVILTRTLSRFRSRLHMPNPKPKPLKEVYRASPLKGILFKKEPQENLPACGAMGAFPAVALAPVALGWRSECNIEGLDVQARKRTCRKKERKQINVNSTLLLK